MTKQFLYINLYIYMYLLYLIYKYFYRNIKFFLYFFKYRIVTHNTFSTYLTICFICIYFMSSTNYSYAHNLSKILKDEQEDDQKVEEALHYEIRAQEFQVCLVTMVEQLKEVTNINLNNLIVGVNIKMELDKGSLQREELQSFRKYVSLSGEFLHNSEGVFKGSFNNT